MKILNEIITPERAAELLQNNPKNRHLRGRRVAAYANALKNGEWKQNTDPIAISEDGELLNGQHRLVAIIKSGVSMDCLVAYDCPKDTIFDKGAERNIGDSLYMRGLISKRMSTTFIVAIVNCYFSMAYERYPFEYEVEEFINKHETDLYNAFTISHTCENKHSRRICGRAPVQAAILGALIKGIDKSKLTSFCYVANTGFAEAKEQYFAIVLRKEVESITSHGRFDNKQLCMFAQRAIDDFVNGKSRTRKYTHLRNLWIEREDNESI